MTEKHIILASNSPRRKELLKQAGFIFTVIPSNVEEVITETEPKEIVKELSGQKAKNIFDNLSKESAANSLILGADTVVAWENEKGMFSILGKPKDKEDAFAMLKNLQGKGAVYVKEIAGDYNNVVGLPLSALYQIMKQFKIF